MKKLISALIVVILFTVPSFALAPGIIILNIVSADYNMLTYNYLLWLTTTAPVAKPNVQSSWSGANAAEVASLQAGTIIEEPYSITVASSTSTTALKALLNAQYLARQAYFNSQLPPGQYYGVYFDTNTQTWSQ